MRASALIVIACLGLSGCGRDASPTAPTESRTPSLYATDSTSGSIVSVSITLVFSVVGSTVRLAWTSIGAATQYRIEAGSRPGASDLATIDTGGPAPFYEATGVGAGAYYVRVRALGGGEISTPSNEVLIVVGGQSPGPPQPPQPPPTAPPPQTEKYYLWGGTSRSVFLGTFTCVFCVEYDTDSVNNPYGRYGSQYSSTSIRNAFSLYGGPYNTYSPCNPYTANPPRVYNSTRTVTYGLLTLNQYLAGAITSPSIVQWLRSDVCR